MKIALHGKSTARKNPPFVQTLCAELQKHGVELLISEPFAEIVAKWDDGFPAVQTFAMKDDLSGIDLMISLGGDGTLLDSVTYSGASEVPILGINTGRMGFLATSSSEHISEIVYRLIHGKYEIENRMLIRVEMAEDLFGGLNFGLNEFTVLKQDTSSMITVHAWLNDEYLNAYWADGLIVATPTGSTGYSLSCGGPVVVPQSHSFILTPVSPHNLSVRPLVVSDSSTISLEVEARSKYFLVSIDSRSRTVRKSQKIHLCRERFCARLVKFEGSSFVVTLRSKLNWGFDVRN